MPTAGVNKDVTLGRPNSSENTKVDDWPGPDLNGHDDLLGSGVARPEAQKGTQNQAETYFSMSVHATNLLVSIELR